MLFFLKQIPRRITRIPYWISYTIGLYLAKRPASIKNRLNEQNYSFHRLGLDRNAAIKKINAICLNLFGIKYNENNGMFSEHLILISAICISRKKISKILEIGTFDGRSSAVLATLFPESEIVTVDLPATDSDFTSYYQRKTSAIEFTNKRDKLLSNHQNVTFYPLNSINLTLWTAQQFDMIWVDGAHGYPMVGFDILNAYRLARPGGYVLMDDIHTFVKRTDRMYASTASYEILQEFVKCDLISEFYLIRKRMGARFNVKKLTEKFVGIFKTKQD